jgi:hypothetical protein
MLDVRCHDGPGPGVFLRQHKRHQVDLSESAWAHHAVVSHTSILHVVGSETQISTKVSSHARTALHKVLDGCAYATTLHSFDVCSADGSRKMRVLGEALEAL